MRSKNTGSLADLIKPCNSRNKDAWQAFDNFFSSPGSSTDPLLQRQADWNNESALEATIRLVDEIFFYGMVRRRVPFALKDLGPGKYGHTCWKVEDGARSIFIEINIRKINNVWAFFGTLVHEMARAYIRLHICHCSSCKCAETQQRLDQLGATEHGSYWQRLSLTAEVLTQELIEMKLDLGRTIGAEEELKKAVKEEGLMRYLRDAFGEQQGDRMFSDWRARRARENRSA